jgi:uncharacterized glyoxalase superfamily protein PhnB
VMQLLINIDVGDVEKAIQFYQAALGLQVSRRFGDHGVEMSGGPAPIYLLLKAAGSRASSTTTQIRSYDRHWTSVHLDFVVEEIHSAIQRALAAGATLEGEVSTARWGKLALLADPFGHGFCFIQFIGRGYDEIATTVD